MTAPGAASPTTSWFSAAALVALSATFSLQAMADDTKPMTAVQIQQAQESADAMTKLREAETKSLDAERKRLEAQIALDEAKKKLNPAAPDPAAQAVAAAKTQKEVADAEKAAAESRIAAFKAKYGGVPDSGIAGEVTLGDKAGALEMALLAYRAVATVADGVAKVVKAKVVDKAGSPVNKNASLYAFAAAQVPDFQAVASFRVQRAAVSEALRRASEAAKAALGRVEPTPETTPAMVGVALESITKLLGFFRSDYKVGGSEITLDDIALVQAVVGQDLGIPSFVPSIYNPAVVEGAAKLVEAELSELSTQFAQSRMLADDLEQLIRQRQEQAGQATTTASLKLSLEREIATLRGLSDRLKTAATGYDTVLARLMAPDEATASIFRNLAIWNALKDGGAYLLVLKVQRAGGSHYTEKNLWNFFGKMPFYVAGGVVVSYTLFKGNDGAVVASGVMPVHGGFESVTRVPTLK